MEGRVGGAHLLWNLVNCFFWKVFVCDVGVLFCRIWIAFPAHGGNGRMGMCFPGCLIGSVLAACFAVVIKYLGGCLTVCLALSCAGGAVCGRRGSIFVFYIGAFQRM